MCLRSIRKDLSVARLLHPIFFIALLILFMNTVKASQESLLNNWLNDHIQDAQNILQKQVLFREFGESLRTSNDNQRDQLLFNSVYSAIYLSASSGGAAAGGMFWQLLTEKMDAFRDGHEVVSIRGCIS
ncbi:hypothetical protein NC652_005364 [Populus alba x Populus x berolinensis]|nr:hypothetical protein NC652_005364 [Populus alba x Populus x berolinensis]